MSECTKNSDRDCCYTCNHFGYEMENKHDTCLVTHKCTNAWSDACAHYSRVFQGFGE